MQVRFFLFIASFILEKASFCQFFFYWHGLCPKYVKVCQPWSITADQIKHKRTYWMYNSIFGIRLNGIPNICNTHPLRRTKFLILFPKFYTFLLRFAFVQAMPIFVPATPAIQTVLFFRKRHSVTWQYNSNISIVWYVMCDDDNYASIRMVIIFDLFLSV